MKEPIFWDEPPEIPPIWKPVYQAEPIYTHVAVLSLMPNMSDRARKHG